jgi:nucleotide-binding universal stress UspA family protein
MTRKVLVALDGSAAAALAIPTARTLARQLGAELHAVHATEKGKPDQVRAALGLDRPEFSDVELGVVSGNPVEAVLQAASSPRVALTVLATHGREVTQGRPLAPIPEKLAANARHPVVLVRPEAAAAIGDEVPPFRRLLLPLDGKAATAGSLGPAVGLARDLGATLDVLYVVYIGQIHPGQAGIVTPRYVDQPYLEWPHWAEEARAWLRACCRQGVTEVPTEVYVRGVTSRERVGATIVDFATEADSDAIILVRLRGLEPGREPVARAVLDLAPCPVLLCARKPRPRG